MESRVRDEWAVLSGSALAHVLWLPNGYCTMNQTGTQTQTLLRHKNIVKTWKKFSVSIHYELLLFFFCKGGVIIHCYWKVQFGPLSTVQFQRRLFMILTNFDAFFEDNSFLHSFCNASSLTKNKLKSSNTWREPKILFSCILTYLWETTLPLTTHTHYVQSSTHTVLSIRPNAHKIFGKYSILIISCYGLKIWILFPHNVPNTNLFPYS